MHNSDLIFEALMSTAELRRSALKQLELLPADKVKVAAEFLTYLGHHASDEATEELLRIPGLLKRVKQSRRETKAGKGVDWRLMN